MDSYDHLKRDKDEIVERQKSAIERERDKYRAALEAICEAGRNPVAEVALGIECVWCGGTLNKHTPDCETLLSREGTPT